MNDDELLGLQLPAYQGPIEKDPPKGSILWPFIEEAGRHPLTTAYDWSAGGLIELPRDICEMVTDNGVCQWLPTLRPVINTVDEAFTMPFKKLDSMMRSPEDYAE